MAFDSKYEPIREHDGTPVVDSEEVIPMMGLPFRKERYRQKMWSWSTCLVVYSAALTTIIFVLIVHRFIYPASNEGSKDSKFPARFSYDLNYMSADHKFDHLWDDPDGPPPSISLADPEYGGEVSEAVISM
jgi:hypothetical protein